MAVGWAEPIAIRLPGLACRFEGLKVLSDFTEKLLLGLFRIRGFGDELGESIELGAALMIRVRSPSVGSIGGRSGAPHFVTESDVIAIVLKEQWVARDLRVPDGPAKNRSSSCAPKVLTA